MQKKMNAKTIGDVKLKRNRLENKKVIKMIKIDEAKTYEKVVGF